MKGKLYEFLCLCFALAPAPLIFFRSSKNCNCNILVITQILRQTIEKIFIFLLQDLGFVMNLKKSQLIPGKEVNF